MFGATNLSSMLCLPFVFKKPGSGATRLWLGDSIRLIVEVDNRKMIWRLGERCGHPRIVGTGYTSDTDLR